MCAQREPAVRMTHSSGPWRKASFQSHEIRTATAKKPTPQPAAAGRGCEFARPRVTIVPSPSTICAKYQVIVEFAATKMKLEEVKEAPYEIT